MKALLYKDFLAFKGKYIVAGMALVMVLFGICCGILSEPGNTDKEFILYLIYSLILTIVVMIPIMFTKYVFVQDEKSRCKAYIMSLPLSKNVFVAEKYVLYIIAYYIINSFSVMMTIIVNAALSNEEIILKVSMIQTMIMGLSFILLLIHALQLPGYLICGVQKADEINMAIFILAFLALLPVFLFMDFQNMDPDFLIRHRMIAATVISLAFLVVMFLFYLSYRYTLGRILKREMCYGE